MPAKLLGAIDRLEMLSGLLKASSFDVGIHVSSTIAITKFGRKSIRYFAFMSLFIVADSPSSQFVFCVFPLC